jgi:hypothetical protein
MNAWAKPDAFLICGDCGIPMDAEGAAARTPTAQPRPPRPEPLALPADDGNVPRPPMHELGTDKRREADIIVDYLRSAVAEAIAGLNGVPGLLRRVIDEDLWCERVIIRTGQIQHFDRFIDFVTEQPLEGLGIDVATLRRLCRDNQSALDAIDRVTTGGYAPLRDQARIRPLALKDPTSIGYAWQMTDRLKRLFQLRTLSQQDWDEAVAEAERNRIFERVPSERPYGSMDALLQAEIGIGKAASQQARIPANVPLAALSPSIAPTPRQDQRRTTRKNTQLTEREAALLGPRDMKEPGSKPWVYQTLHGLKFDWKRLDLTLEEWKQSFAELEQY